MTETDLPVIAKLFLFDLENSAKEQWFKTEETWELSIGDTVKKAAIEKAYYPVISVCVSQPLIKELFVLVSHQVHPGKTVIMDAKVYKGNETLYLIAYNPGRRRR